jgi:hypothetical protein
MIYHRGYFLTTAKFAYDHSKRALKKGISRRLKFFYGLYKPLG